MGCGEIMLAGRREREREDGRPGNRLRGVRTGQSGHRLHPDHCLSPTLRHTTSLSRLLGDSGGETRGYHDHAPGSI